MGETLCLVHLLFAHLTKVQFVPSITICRSSKLLNVWKQKCIMNSRQKDIYISIYIYIYRQAFSVHLITTFFFHVEFRDVHKWHLHIPNIWHEQSTSHQAFCTMVFIMGTILVNRSYFTGGWSEMFSSLVQHSLGLSYTGGRPGHLSFMCR
jgi:hypothetical protein